MTSHSGKIAGAILIATLAGLIAGGCTPGSKPPPAENAVYAVAVALTSADTIALRYVTLPLCGSTHPKPLCSEAAVTAKIKANAQVAHDAVVAAEANPGALPAAQAAVDVLVKSTPKTGEKP